MSMPVQPSGGRLAPAAEALDHRRSADAVRSEYLQSVGAGLVSVHDVIASATSPHSRPLLRITVRQLLLAQQDWGETRTGECLRRVCLFTGTDTTRSAMNRLDIGWLMDPRARGTRLLAFIDATSPASGQSPWPGFPFHPAPPSALAQGATP